MCETKDKKEMQSSTRIFISEDLQRASLIGKFPFYLVALLQKLLMTCYELTLYRQRAICNTFQIFSV